jgi:rubredoxin---NAD+ reductase
MSQPIVIIGAGLAGWTTAREVRKLDALAPIVLITADSGDFYAKPSLSNAFAQGKLPAQLVSTPAGKMAETLNVRLLPNTRVQAIDTVAQLLATSAGIEPYSRLVLATGAQPIRVPVDGNAARRILTVNSLDDFSVFHAQLQSASGDGAIKPHVLIMGAGLIGCEFANDLTHAGYRVSVVDPGPRALALLLPADASADLQAALEGKGVRFHFGTTLKNLHQTAGGALDARLADGTALAPDLVLSAVGLRADTMLAQTTGLLVERGIVVDARLQTSAPHVYALGDAAQYISAATPLSAHGSTLPYVMPIMSAAKVLAANLTGTHAELSFSLMPVSVKTPALPLVVALPRAGTAGDWKSAEKGLWQWLDETGIQRGFVLAGAQTAQRMIQSKLVAL